MEPDRTKASEFIKEAAGPSGMFGVFEAAGETGYLYLYEPQGQGVRRHLHIYNRTSEVNVAESDVEVEWSADQTKCGVRIWDEQPGDR